VASPAKPNLNNEANALQAKIFSRWCSQKLQSTRGRRITDIVKEIGDGVVLIWLIEVLSEQTFTEKYDPAPKTRISKIDK